MKTIFKKTPILLKTVVLGCLLTASFAGAAQQRAVTLDPKLGTIKMTDLAGNIINEQFVQSGQLVKLVVPVLSVAQYEAIPKGSAKIKIGLGSKLTIDPQFDLNTVNSSNLFTWTKEYASGQWQLTGDLTSSIPASFHEVVVAFKVLGNVLGTSTITANFLVTNHNTVTILSDNDGNNNAAFLKYSISNAAVPAPLTKIDSVVKSNCSVIVKYSIDREIGVSKYEVEFSKNAIDFVNVANHIANNAASYETSSSVPKDLQAAVIFVRIKTSFANGSVAYSAAKSISGLCGDKWAVELFPNPSKFNDLVTVRATSGMFNNSYAIAVYDATGRTIETKKMDLRNLESFKYRIGNWAAGAYMMKIVSIDGKEVAYLRFEKM